MTQQAAQRSPPVCRSPFYREMIFSNASHQFDSWSLLGLLVCLSSLEATMKPCVCWAIEALLCWWCKPMNWTKLTSALLIYGILVLLKCIEWWELTCCGEIKWWDSPGGQETSFIFNCEKQKKGSRHPSWLLLVGLCQVTQIMAATSSLRITSCCSFPAFTETRAELPCNRIPSEKH